MKKDLTKYSKPLVSVILPTFNRAEYIKKSIESVLIQNYENFELIVVNDGSIDNTLNIISNFAKKDPRIKIINNKVNIGLAKSLNKGIKKANGKYVARIDDDDFWCDKDKLKKQAEFLNKNSNYALVGGGVIKINKKGKEIVRHRLPEKDKEIREKMLLDDCFVHPAVMFKKSSWQKAGGYNENLSFSEDWDLWLKLGKIGKLYNFPDYFVCYLQGGQNVSSYNIKRNLKININLRKKYKNDYPHFWKAYFLGWAYYFYAFLPFKKTFRPLLSKIKKIIFGEPVYLCQK